MKSIECLFSEDQQDPASQRQMGEDKEGREILASPSGNPFEIILVSGIIFDGEEEATT